MVPVRVEGVMRGGWGRCAAKRMKPLATKERKEQNIVRESTCTRVASLESILESMREESVVRERECPRECERFTRQARDQSSRNRRHRMQAHLPPWEVRVE